MQNLGMNLGCVGSGHPVGVWTPPTRPEARGRPFSFKLKN
jgi:hypothetical protein